MLSITRTVMIKYKLGAIMALLFLTVSCSDDGTNEKAIARSALAATDYFRAIYFLDGPAAGALGDYQQLSISSLTNDAKVIKEVRAFQNRVVQYIGEKHPGFFETFKTQITSGDYRMVKAAIKNGVSQYREALQTLSNDKFSEKETSDIAKRYLAKYGAKHMSKAKLAASVKEFAKDVTDEKLSGAEKTADLEGTNAYVVTNYYYYYYVVAGAAVLVVLIVLFEQTPVDPPFDPIDPPPTLDIDPIDPGATETEATYLFDDYAATITAGMVTE